jgi:hypothetical protein
MYTDGQVVLLAVSLSCRAWVQFLRTVQLVIQVISGNNEYNNCVAHFIRSPSVVAKIASYVLHYHITHFTRVRYTKNNLLTLSRRQHC